MGKRLHKLFQADLAKEASSLVGKDINIVLKSNQTFLGRCLKVENQMLFIKDFRNHPHSLAFTQIEAVIYDQSSLYWQKLTFCLNCLPSNTLRFLLNNA